MNRLNMTGLCATATAMLLAGQALAQPNLLTNPSYELDDPTGNTAPLGWVNFNQGGQPSTDFARTGQRSLKQAYAFTTAFVGTWNNFFDPDTLTFPYAPNTLYKTAPLNVSAWYLVPSSNPVSAGTTFGSVKISVFRTANGSIYQEFEYPNAVVGSTNGQWQQLVRTIQPSDFGTFGLEPAVGASVRTTFMTFMFDGTTTPNNTAVIYWDDVSLSQGAVATCYANCDNSTTPPVLNAGDFSCFLSKFRTGCP